MEYLVISILTTLLIGQAVIHYRERKDMLNRLMAKDYTDYKTQEDPATNQEDPQDPTIDIEDAREEIDAEEE